MATSDHISNDQFWFNKWRKNLDAPGKTMDWEEWRRDPRNTYDSNIREWTNSDWFHPAKFPTDALMRYDPKVHNPRLVWDHDEKVARRQAPPKRPEGGYVHDETKHEYEDTAKHIHESMRGTGVPEHVTIYRFGKFPHDAIYGSGSVDPNWPEEVRSGWRKNDVNINRGRLHIFLVPHEDIVQQAGVEGEVFFRRGSPMNKTSRSRAKQREAKARHEDSWTGITDYPHINWSNQ